MVYLQKWRERFRDKMWVRFRWAYLVQSAIAAGYILVTYLVIDILSGWAITSLAASTFIAFSFPHAASSRPRYLMGGYCVAAVVGSLCARLLVFFAGLGVPEAQVLCCTLAMLVTMLVMVIMDFEHPPAAALCITLVLAEQPAAIGLAALVSVSFLSLLKHRLSPWLQNL